MRLLFPALLMLSCAPGSEASLSVVRVSYQTGERATLTLRNTSLTRLGFNLCFSELRTAEGSPVDDQDGTACQAIQEALEAGAMATGRSRPLPAGLPSGAYRYRTSIEEPGGQRLPIESASFTVGP